MSELITRHLTIHGRVQGVGFRNYMVYKAGELGLCGWVRNRIDGSVEAIVWGTPEMLDAIIACAHRGPRSALVTNVTVTVMNSEETCADFSMRPTV